MHRAVQHGTLKVIEFLSETTWPRFWRKCLEIDGVWGDDGRAASSVGGIASVSRMVDVSSECAFC